LMNLMLNEIEAMKDSNRQFMAVSTK